MYKLLMRLWLPVGMFSIFVGLIAAGATQADERIVIPELKMEFVRIPGGTFIMSSSPDEPFRDASETPHEVVISKPFYMQSTEVTLGQWQAVMGRKFFSRRKGTSITPVTWVSGLDTQDFIKKANYAVKGAYTFRLPTEAEWEYAARGETQTPYFWGDQINCAKAMYENNRGKRGACVAHNDARDIPVDEPSRVKRYAPNAFGLYDMHGNVWEWVQDWYGAYDAQTVTDPKGPKHGTMRVKRGGSWYRYGYSCRSTNRAMAHPASRLQTTGFRLVLEKNNQ